jgi:nucleotidyltransferase substrate binding protein (TIGR01987 family)
METTDIRWQQRFANFNKAMRQLKKFIDKNQADSLNELEIQGLIQAFEYTFELAWNVMKDFMEYQGAQEIYGSRDALVAAFNKGLIADGEQWMEMFQNRNKTSHTYNEETANEIARAILTNHYFLFFEFQKKMNEIKTGQTDLKFL